MQPWRLEAHLHHNTNNQGAFNVCNECTHYEPANTDTVVSGGFPFCFRFTLCFFFPLFSLTLVNIIHHKCTDDDGHSWEKCFNLTANAGAAYSMSPVFSAPKTLMENRKPSLNVPHRATTGTATCTEFSPEPEHGSMETQQAA